MGRASERWLLRSRKNEKQGKKNYVTFFIAEPPKNMTLIIVKRVQQRCHPFPSSTNRSVDSVLVQLTWFTPTTLLDGSACTLWGCCKSSSVKLGGSCLSHHLVVQRETRTWQNGLSCSPVALSCAPAERLRKRVARATWTAHQRCRLRIL